MRNRQLLIGALVAITIVVVMAARSRVSAGAGDGAGGDGDGSGGSGSGSGPTAFDERLAAAKAALVERLKLQHKYETHGILPATIAHPQVAPERVLEVGTQGFAGASEYIAWRYICPGSNDEYYILSNELPVSGFAGLSSVRIGPAPGGAAKAILNPYVHEREVGQGIGFQLWRNNTDRLSDYGNYSPFKAAALFVSDDGWETFTEISSVGTITQAAFNLGRFSYIGAALFPPPGSIFEVRLVIGTRTAGTGKFDRYGFLNTAISHTGLRTNLVLPILLVFPPSV